MGMVYNQDFNWKLIWCTSLEITCSNKEMQFQWNITDNAIFTEHRLQLTSFFLTAFAIFVGLKLKMLDIFLYYVHFLKEQTMFCRVK